VAALQIITERAQAGNRFAKLQLLLAQANQGDASAQFQVAEMYRHEFKNFEQALRWYKAAADHGVTAAQDMVKQMQSPPTWRVPVPTSFTWQNPVPPPAALTSPITPVIIDPSLDADLARINYETSQDLWRQQQEMDQWRQQNALDQMNHNLRDIDWSLFDLNNTLRWNNLHHRY
jgi:TPR repeat protein